MLQVSSVLPSGGPISGGTLVTIRGVGFRTAEQEDAYREQWAAAASSRTQYSDASGAAAQAVGPPDASGCGDDRLEPRAWMPAVGTDVPDWLQVRPCQAAIATEMPPGRLCVPTELPLICHWIATDGR